MHTLEIGYLRLVACFDERLKAGLDQRRNTATQDGLLAKQVGLCLFPEGGLQDTCPGTADSLRIGQGRLLCLPGNVLVDRQQSRDAGPLREDLAHEVSWRLGREYRENPFRRPNLMLISANNVASSLQFLARLERS